MPICKSNSRFTTRMIIQHMRLCGWKVMNTGEIYHPDISIIFKSWEDAIKGCIEVASEA